MTAYGQVFAQDCTGYNILTTPSVVTNNCFDGAIEVVVQNGTAPYQVSFLQIEQGFTVNIPNSFFGDTINLEFLALGAYEVTVEDSEGCSITSDPLVVGGECLVELNGLVFLDTNENGLPDAEEPLLEGVMVMLNDEEGQLLEFNTSNSDGSFGFTTEPGNYEIVVPDELPDGSTFLGESVMEIELAPGPPINDFYLPYQAYILDAVNDSIYIGPADTVQVLVLDNDLGDNLIIDFWVQPEFGSISLSADGISFEYIAPEGFLGEDSFNYTIIDDKGGSSTGTVSVFIFEGPIAEDDFYETEVGVDIVMDPLSNDQGISITLSTFNQPIPGGEVIWFDDNDQLIFTVAEGFIGTATFQYVIVDAAGNTAEATVTIEVGAAAAVQAIPDVASTQQGVPVSIDVLSNDVGVELSILDFSQPQAGGTVAYNTDSTTLVFTPDPDFTGTATFEYGIQDSTGTAALGGVSVLVEGGGIQGVDDEYQINQGDNLIMTVLDNDIGEGLLIAGFIPPENGTVTDLGDGQLLLEPDSDFLGTITINYSIIDAEGNLGSAVVTVTIVQTDLSAVDDEYAIEAGMPASLDVLANDIGVDLAISNFTQPADASVSDAGDGTLTFTPGITFVGTTSFMYTIVDAEGNNSTAMVTVTVSAPELTLQDDTASTLPGESTVIPVLMNDFGQGLTVTGFSQPLEGGTVVFGTGPGELIFSASEDFSGNVVFTYDAEDQFGTVATASVVVTVMDPSGLLAVDDEEQIQSGANGVFEVLANDQGMEIFISSFEQPVSGGTVAFGPGTSLLFIPEDGFAGVVTFTYTITDANGEFATATVTVNVTLNLEIEAVNDEVSTDFSTPIIIDVLANDTGDNLSILDFGQPSIGGAVIEDPDGGGLVFTPFEDFAGVVNFGYTITDGQGNIDDAVVTVNVENVGNQPPCNDPLFFCTGVLQPFDMCFENCDPDGDSIYIESAFSTFNCSVDIFNDTCLTYGPLPGFQGVDSVLVVLCDNQLPPNCSTTFVTVGVGECEDPIAIDDYAITNFGSPVIVDFLINDAGTGLTLLDFEQPANATVSVSGEDFLVTPDNGFSGDIFFDYTVTDIFGATATATVFVTVAPPLGPVAFNDEAQTDENVPVTVDVLANDQGDGISISGVEQPMEGGMAEIVGGEIVFSPAADFVGTVMFDYEIMDEDGATATATVIVEVLAGCGNITQLCTEPMLQQELCFSFCDLPADENVSISEANTLYTCSITFDSDTCITYTALPGAEGLEETLEVIGCTAGGICDTIVVDVVVTCTTPIAANDNFTTQVNASVDFQVLDNDDDPCNDPFELEVTVTGDPSNGTIVTQDNGQMTYQPNPGFTGTDTFTYTACNDCMEDGLCDEAIVTINVGGDPVDELVANPDEYTTEPATAITMNVMDNDTGSGIMVTSNTMPDNGSLIQNGNSFDYIPADGFTGTDAFTYTITDENGDTAETTVTILVEGPQENQAPIALNDMASSEGEPVEIAVLTNDNDPEGGLLTITDFDIPDVGTLELTDDGTFIYTPEVDYEGTVSFEYTVCDDGEPVLCDSAMVEIAVGVPPSNTAPIAVDDATETDAGGAIVIDVLLNDSDPDGDAIIIAGTTDPENGTVEINLADGTITYVPDPLFDGVDSFTYTICDDAEPQLCSEATVTITVNPTVMPPEFDVEADVVFTNFNTPVEVFVLLNDSGTGLTITEFSQGEFGSVIQSGNEGALIYSPSGGFSGQDYFFYTACDEDGNCMEALVSVTVYPEGEPNHAPVANDDLYELDPGASANFDVLANDLDPENQGLTITEVSDPMFGTVTISADGSSVDYQAADGFTGIDEFTYTVCDEGTPQECSTATVTVVIGVEVPNTPPTAVDDYQDVDANLVVTIVVTVNDFDAETANTDLDVTLLSQPLHGTAAVSPGSNEVTYTPDANYEGPDYFLYLACDDGNPVLCDTAQVIIQVGEPVQPPSDLVAQPDIAYTNLSSQVDINVLANDSGIGLVITNFSDPANGTVIFGPTSDELTYIPNGSFVGTDYFVYTVCDEEGSCATTLVAVVIVDQDTQNVPPVAVNDVYQTGEGESINFNVMENDSDPFGGTMIEVCDFTDPSNGALIQEADGTFTYFPADGFIGQDTFSYTICDNGEPTLSSGAIVTITVGTGALSNQFPVAVDDFMAAQTNEMITIPVLDNDSDPDGDNLTVILLTPPANGLAEVSEGQVVYTSDLGFIGTDYLMYQICDDGSPALYDTAFVTIEVIADQVTEVTANDDAATSVQNVPVTVPILGNDSWPIDSLINVTILTQPISGGTVLVNGDNSVQYNPPIDFIGEDSFEYILCAGTLCDTATVSMTVLPEEDVTVPCDIIIQQGISPNGDGINDAFEIAAMDCYEEQNPELIIFNRWGSEVYREQPFTSSDSWDGTWDVNGEDLPDGTYFYILILDENDSEETLQGFIELRR